MLCSYYIKFVLVCFLIGRPKRTVVLNGIMSKPVSHITMISHVKLMNIKEVLYIII